MIRVVNLTKRYGRTVAVKDISFAIEPGEIVGFLGPNGAGKTTTMRILSCFLPPTRGTVTIAGLDVVRDSLAIRKRVGYLPETVPLYTEMRVDEYLRFRAQLRGLSGAARRDRVREVLKLCSLSDVSRFVIGRLSKGYRQRVGLADTLLHNPDLLILDEPTIGLDPNQIRHVRALIKSLARNHTVLLSTHILSEVEMMCDRVLIINRGRIVASDTPESLVGRLRGNVRFIAEVRGPLEPVMKKCHELPHVVEATGEAEGDWSRVVIECEKGSDIRSELFALIVENGWPLRELKVAPDRNLEDVFVAMTEEGRDQA